MKCPSFFLWKSLQNKRNLLSGMVSVCLIDEIKIWITIICIHTQIVVQQSHSAISMLWCSFKKYKIVFCCYCFYSVSSPPSLTSKNLSLLKEESHRSIFLGFIYDYLTLAVENRRNIEFISAGLWGLSPAYVFIPLEIEAKAIWMFSVQIVSGFCPKCVINIKIISFLST